MNFSVLQWNIWFKEKIEEIAEYLVHNKADIICLQELSIDNPEQSVHNAVTYIAEKLGYEYAFQKITFEDDSMKLANAIFSRYPIKKSRSVWINEPTGTGHYDDEYRAYVETAIQINGKLLTVGTVHMSYTNAFMPTPRKLKETQKLLNHTKRHHSKYILTGDFNAMPDSVVLQNISKQFVNAGPNDTQKSWTTKPFSYDGFKANTLDWRLDYIFTTPDVKTMSSEIVQTNLSDHLPILASFEI